MNEQKKLGRISDVRFGIGGYQNAMIGLTLQFDLKDTSVGTFDGYWVIERSEHAKWTEDERLLALGKVCMNLSELLSLIGGSSVDDLIDKPVEVTLDGNRLTSWRLLTEVLP